MRLEFGVVVVLGSLGALILGERLGRLFVTLISILVALTAAWVLAVLAVRADYRAADGFVDCWPYCSAWQDAVGATLFFAPLTALFLVAAAVLLLLLGGRARKRSLRD